VVRAFDADVSDRLRFSLLGGSAGIFAINASSGAVYTIGLPDYERETTYTLEVAVTDGAGHQVSTELMVKISDVSEFGFFGPGNDEQFVPTIPQPASDNPIETGLEYHVYVTEHVVRDGDVLFKATAGETQGVAVAVQYSTAPIAADVPFVLDEVGWFLSTGSVDREVRDEYRV
jgi:hypothetical protein